MRKKKYKLRTFSEMLVDSGIEIQMLNDTIFLSQLESSETMFPDYIFHTKCSWELDSTWQFITGLLGKITGYLWIHNMVQDNSGKVIGITLYPSHFFNSKLNMAGAHGEKIQNLLRSGLVHSGVRGTSFDELNDMKNARFETHAL